MENEYRLTPAMASRKLQVASFWHQYKARWGRAPSYGEIAGAMKIERSTARSAVLRAQRDGLIDRVPGARRGESASKPVILRLDPDVAELVIAQLRSAGVILLGAGDLDGRTTCPLPLAPELDHIPSGDDGDEQDARTDAGRDSGHARDHDPGAPEGDRRAA